MTDQTRIPKQIVIDYSKVGTPDWCLVDGEPFPFEVGMNLTHQVEPLMKDGFGYVLMPIYADRIEIRTAPADEETR